MHWDWWTLLYLDGQKYESGLWCRWKNISHSIRHGEYLWQTALSNPENTGRRRSSLGRWIRQALYCAGNLKRRKWSVSVWWGNYSNSYQHSGGSILCLRWNDQKKRSAGSRGTARSILAENKIQCLREIYVDKRRSCSNGHGLSVGRYGHKWLDERNCRKYRYS